MKNSVLLLIAKMGVRAYTNQRIGKLSSAKRLIRRWTESDTIKETEYLKDLLRHTATKNMSSEERDCLRMFLQTGRKGDAMVFMKNVVGFYMKRHRFKFDDDVSETLNNPTASFDVMYTVYESTVEQVERIHNFYFKSIVRSTRGTQRRDGTRVGPFNMYVKDQWRIRRDELRSICLNQKSTDVMRILSNEWKSDKQIRDRYMNEGSMPTTVPTTVSMPVSIPLTGQ
jgi:hypothetical protein